ncbi:ABC transporter transmembrane domain-containing protein, partial [Acinetobacter pittii]|uniref:ABC transporter transmembrane domain-containing protein n=1 Tax=Acinetobacter pittii TaxID=48296 RepID=UPI0028137329
NGYVEEMYNGQAVVQSFNYQQRANAAFAKLNEALKTTSRKAETTAGAISPITTLVNDLGYVTCAVLG